MKIEATITIGRPTALRQASRVTRMPITPSQTSRGVSMMPRLMIAR